MRSSVSKTTCGEPFADHRNSREADALTIVRASSKLALASALPVIPLDSCVLASLDGCSTFLDRKAASPMSADTLSEVLRAVRLRGAIFYYIDGISPWVAEAPPAGEIAAAILPGAEHMIEYHVVTKGRCFGTLVGGD